VLDIPIASIVLGTPLLYDAIQSKKNLKAHLNKHQGHKRFKVTHLGFDCQHWQGLVVVVYH
jgi:hypothetical protein